MRPIQVYTYYIGIFCQKGFVCVYSNDPLQKIFYWNNLFLKLFLKESIPMLRQYGVYMPFKVYNKDVKCINFIFLYFSSCIKDDKLSLITSVLYLIMVIVALKPKPLYPLNFEISIWRFLRFFTRTIKALLHSISSSTYSTKQFKLLLNKIEHPRIASLAYVPFSL